MNIHLIVLSFMTVLVAGCSKTADSSSDDQWDDSWGDEDHAEAEGEGEGEGDHHQHDHQFITTIVLDLYSFTDGSDQTIRWVDGEGPDDDIYLTRPYEYDLSISILNELEDPVEDITPEILDESDQHQVFFTGSAVEDGLVAYTYNDSDDEGLPIGIFGTIEAVATGFANLTVTLRHLPLENGEKIKVADMADTVAEEGLDGISGIGDNDFSIDFPITVQ